MTDDPTIRDLRTEVERLLAAALETDRRHSTEMDRRDELHVAETGRRDALHIEEVQRRDELHHDELELIRVALETRDVIGQAKGVIMAAMACSPDEAFHLLRTQSQHENRKLVEVAAEVAGRASRGNSFGHRAGGGRAG